MRTLSLIFTLLLVIPVFGQEDEIKFHLKKLFVNRDKAKIFTYSKNLAEIKCTLIDSTSINKVRFYLVEW